MSATVAVAALYVDEVGRPAHGRAVEQRVRQQHGAARRARRRQGRDDRRVDVLLRFFGCCERALCCGVSVASDMFVGRRSSREQRRCC